MRRMKDKKTNGFTLIELLIVVMIIAILAAIALPNFLEFQTRAKVSRVMNDLRVMATAIEAYNVDNNSYSPSLTECDDWEVPFTPTDDTNKYLAAQTFLTTPIRYLSSALVDPFLQNRTPVQRFDFLSTDPYYDYWRNTQEPGLMQDAFENGYVWWVSSAGPAVTTTHPTAGDMFQLEVSDNIYDPTNGTLSQGYITRTNLGLFLKPNISN